MRSSFLNPSQRNPSRVGRQPWPVLCRGVLTQSFRLDDHAGAGGRRRDGEREKQVSGACFFIKAINNIDDGSSVMEGCNSHRHENMWNVQYCINVCVRVCIYDSHCV